MSSDAPQKPSSTLLDLLGISPEEVKAPAPQPAPVQDLFEAWVEDTGIRPGAYLGAQTTDLHRHYMAWCREKGREADMNSLSFGWRLTGLGFVRGRLHRAGKDQRPRLLDHNSAVYFRAWVEQNPAPAGTAIGNKYSLNKARRDHEQEE